MPPPCESCGLKQHELPAAKCTNRRFHRPPLAMRHWVTRYDPDDGEPFGELCDCPIGRDHNGLGNLIG